jgi:hypothetical protein
MEGDMMLARVVTLVVLLPTAAYAQPAMEGYVMGGAGQWMHNNGSRGALLVAAGGVEWRPAAHLGIAGEGGLFTSRDGGFLFSVGADARLHFRPAAAPRTWAPYVFAGYSPLKFFGLTDHGVQFGGGADYRLDENRAIRLELRDILRESGSISTHYWTVRVGMTFR